jgi:uncharacterized protein
MAGEEATQYSAFEGHRCVGQGCLMRVATQVKERAADEDYPPVLIFADATGEPVEVDFRGSVADVRARLAGGGKREAGAVGMTGSGAAAPRGPGRPRLGVVAREVTLLPRHWEWLNSQPGGASVALRKLVEEARRTHDGKDRVRVAQEAAYRFMSALAGDLPGFEEAARALFAANRQGFDGWVAGWPADVRDYACRLAAPAF